MMRRPFTRLFVTWLTGSALTGCEDPTRPTPTAQPTTAQLEDGTVVDTTPPVITYTIDGTLGQNGWYTSETVTITFTITDPESPAAPGPNTSCGPYTYYDLGVRASDGPLCTAVSAGGTSEVALDILIDRWPPDLSGPFAISPAASAPGWWNTDVSIAYTCNDGAGSGALESNPSATLSTEGVNQGYSLTCADKAGNSLTWDYPFFPLVSGESMTPVYISIDKTPPALAPTVSPNPVPLGSAAAASPNATDALSGVASQSCEPVVTSSVGTRSVTCTATDSANNTVTKSVTYTVVSSLAGFVGLKAPPALNAARAKSSISVKFDLGGDRGLQVLAAGSPTSQAISCVTMAAAAGALEAPTAGSLTYSAKTKLYTYDWRTDRAWAGTCRQLIVKLADGTERRANFQFK
jgi:hypothetical protein